MFEAYHKIFKELGIEYTVVRADTGAMGGSLSEEFQAITNIGEDVLVLCENCDFSSNLEISPNASKEQNDEEEKELQMVETVNKHTIEEVCGLLNLEQKKQ